MPTQLDKAGRRESGTNGGAEDHRAESGAVLSIRRGRTVPRGVRGASETVGFRDTFPQNLLRKVKGSPLLKQSRLSFLLNDDRKVETDSGYIRWVPDDGEGKDTGALLWYINGKSKEFGCFFREVLLSAEYSPPRLLKIQCRVTSESIRQEGSSHHTCVMSEKAEGIQV